MKKLRFDFAIINKDNNLLWLLEVDDVEHIYNHKTPRRIRARERDKVKDNYCEVHKIPLYRMIYPFSKK